MKYQELLPVVALGWMMSACVPQARTDISGVTSAVVELERGACRGRCPQYTVALFADGQVHFNGTANVTTTGRQQRAIAPASVQALMDQHAPAALALTDSMWMDGQPACGAFVTDLPTMHLSVRTASASRRFTVNAGCRNAPASLVTFARAVDSVAAVQSWIGGTAK